MVQKIKIINFLTFHSKFIWYKIIIEFLPLVIYKKRDRKCNGFSKVSLSFIGLSNIPKQYRDQYICTDL